MQMPTLLVALSKTKQQIQTLPSRNCVIFVHSKLQTEVALSTTEAEYICLSQSPRTVLVQMRFFKEIAKRVKSFRYSKPIIRCKVFEDNMGAIELAKAPKAPTPHKTHQHQVSSLSRSSQQRPHRNRTR
jgi:hypothetical protein